VQDALIRETDIQLKESAQSIPCLLLLWILVTGSQTCARLNDRKNMKAETNRLIPLNVAAKLELWLLVSKDFLIIDRSSLRCYSFFDNSAQLCPPRSVVEDFTLPSLVFCCCISRLHADNLSIFVLVLNLIFSLQVISASLYHICTAFCEISMRSLTPWCKTCF